MGLLYEKCEGRTVANVKYLFQRVMNMNYKAMWEKISSIHKKTGRSRLAIFRDMKDCAVKYGAGYMDYDLFEMYNLTPEQRDTYLTLRPQQRPGGEVQRQGLHGPI